MTKYKNIGLDFNIHHDVYYYIMKRTQIYLPKYQHDRLKSLALKQQTTVSQVIRTLVDEKLTDQPTSKPGTKPKSAGEWLLGESEWAKKAGLSGPTDLATNMDKYLYGDKQ